MDIQTVVAELTSKFGKNIDTTAITKMLQGVDLSKLSMTDIIAKVQQGGLLGDLDGDGVQESLIDEIKGMVGNKLGGLGSLFGGK